MKRPLIPVALSYLGGILLASLFPLSPGLLLSFSLAMAVLALGWARVRPYLIFVLALGAGWTNFALRTAILSPHDLRQLLGEKPALATLRGKLTETPTQRVFIQDQKESWRSLAQIEVSAIQLERQPWQPASGRVAIVTTGMLTNIFGGQTVEINGVVHPPKQAVAEGTFDYRFYLKQLGIYYQLDATSEQDWRLGSSPKRPPTADRFRAWARRALSLGLPVEDESLRLEWALTLGWKPALTEEVTEPFIRAATYHIFAVDGLRMAIIFGIFFGLLRALTLPRGICGVILIPLIWFYTALTGWPASAIRASVMLTVIVFGWFLRRPSDIMNSLFAAGLIILIWEPQQLYQAGFQLSFCVVLCLILGVPLLHDLWQRLWATDPLLPESLQPRWRLLLRVPGGFIADVSLTSLAAWIGSIPLVAYYFHIVTPISTPANLIAVPLCGLVLMSNLGSLLLAGWFPAAAILFNHAGWFLMECIRKSSHWFADWPKAYFYVAAPDLWTCVLYYALLIGLLTGWLLKAQWRVWRSSAAALGVLVWGLLCWRSHSLTRLHVVPVHGGMTVYFDAPGAKNDLLIDCGATNSVALIMKPFLRAQGVNALPMLALTHGDVRHMGGATLLSELFPVGEICVSHVRFRSPVYRRALRYFEERPKGLRRIARGDRLGPWMVMHPEATDRFAQADDNALVLLGNFGTTRILLVSDLGRPGQNTLLARSPELRADIVITGLPAQNEALSDAFLDTVRPRVIIVADSEYPVWERASLKFSQRLAQRKMPVIYTRWTGAAVIEFRGEDWEVHTMGGGRINTHGRQDNASASILQAPDGKEPDIPAEDSDEAAQKNDGP